MTTIKHCTAKTYFILTTLLILIRSVFSANITTFEEIGLMNRDGSAGRDAINILRCMYYHGLDNQLKIYVSSDRTLLVDMSEVQVNITTVQRVISMCQSDVGFLLSVTSVSTRSTCEADYYVGTLGEVIDARYVDDLQSIVRNVYIGNLSTGRTLATSQATVTITRNVTSTEQYIFTRGNYYGYYNMRLTMHTTDCDSNELVHCPSHECLDVASKYMEFHI